jgi:hypothetical protein
MSAAARETVPKPDARQVQRAIEAYMAVAYAAAEPPVVVRSMLATLHGYAGDFFQAPTFVKDDADAPRRYSLRLGNAHYPHMKLVAELAPDGKTFLFRADAHDAHCCPPAGSPEHAAFRQLMEQNQQVSTAVGSTWAQAGIPTLKSYLKEDLARRTKPPK